MPISFACGQCGKSYTVSDGLAGKRAVCKACNNRMTIPGEASDAPAPAPAPRSAPSSKPAQAEAPKARPASATSPAPAARPASGVPRTAAPSARAVPVARVVEPDAPPVDDIYGLNEAPAPLPPMMPRSAMDAGGAGAPAKKKKGGFFGSGKKKASAKAPSSGRGGLNVFQIIGILVGIAAGVAGSWGLLGKSDVEKFHQTLIGQRAELLAALQPIRSAEAARAASPRVQDILTRMAKHLEDNALKKGRKNDIEEMNTRYSGKHQADLQRILGEFGRIATVPGAIEGLNVMSQLNRLEAIEKRIEHAAR